MNAVVPSDYASHPVGCLADAGVLHLTVELEVDNIGVEA